MFIALPCADQRFWAMLRNRKLTANVITNIVAGDASRNGRNARRSISRASATTTTTTSGTRTNADQPLVANSVYPPAISSSPWARLTSRITPKISPMPSATNAYNEPRATASMKYWT